MLLLALFSKSHVCRTMSFPTTPTTSSSLSSYLLVPSFHTNLPIMRTSSFTVHASPSTAYPLSASFAESLAASPPPPHFKVHLAPMMEYTDRHFRYLLALVSR